MYIIYIDVNHPPPPHSAGWAPLELVNPNHPKTQSPPQFNAPKRTGKKVGVVGGWYPKKKKEKKREK